MEIVKEKNLLDNDISKIIKLFEETITSKIADIEKEEDLKNNDIQKVKENTSKENICYFDLILEKVLNYYLNEIKNLNVKKYFEITQHTYINDEYEKVPKEYREAQRLIDDVIDCYDPCGKYADVYEDAEYIAFHLIRKKFNINGLTLPETLKLEHIKFYSISSSILEKDIDDEIWYIIIYIATHYYVLKRLNYMV